MVRRAEDSGIPATWFGELTQTFDIARANEDYSSPTSQLHALLSNNPDSLGGRKAVSYTHLDVYKRQSIG